MTTYNFVNNFNQIPKEEHFINFYQLASFADPKTCKYHIRRYKVNDNNEFVSIKEYHLPKRLYQKLIKSKRPNSYKMYTVYNLNIVNHPTMSDILTAKSSMLDINSYYYGAAPF